MVIVMVFINSLSDRYTTVVHNCSPPYLRTGRYTTAKGRQVHTTGGFMMSKPHPQPSAQVAGTVLLCLAVLGWVDKCCG